MKDPVTKIMLMEHRHIPACRAIAVCSEPWRSLQENIDFRPYIERKQAHVCTIDGKPAGFIVFTPEPVFARGGYLRAIGVDPGWRRRGIGKKLLAYAEARTMRQAPNFYLCVSSFNRRAQAFYKRLGYDRVGKIPDLILAGSSELIYWKRLRPLSGEKRRM